MYSSSNVEPRQGPSDSDSSELVALVDELLNNLSKKFDGVSSEILSKSTGQDLT